MLEKIVNFINLKLELTNYFEKRHCLTKLVKAENSEGELIYPAEYISQGNYDKVEFDNFDGVSYLRVNGEIDIARTDENRYTPKPRVDVTIPLKLVYCVRKEKLTEDDAYSFDRVRGTIAKQLETDAQDLVNQLNVDKVQISTSSYQTDEQEIWSEETNETGLFQPKFDVVFGAMEVTVLVRAKVDCIPTECDNIESDILKTFDFCKTTVQNRLTSEQVDCLTTWLCGVGSPVTIQLNGVTYTTAAAGSTFNQQVQNSNSTPIGTAANPSIISDSQAQVNGVNTETIPATVTHNQLIQSTSGASIGTAANPSIVGNGRVLLNGVSTTVVEPEGTRDIPVLLNGSPSGSWDGTSWNVTSTPCAELSVELFSDSGFTIPASNIDYGGTLYIRATPTNITPTTYTAFSECMNNSLTFIGEQASGDFTWIVDGMQGSNTIYVVANDGVSEVVGTTSLTINASLLFNLYSTLDGWSTKRLKESFQDYVLRIQRDSDNAEDSFYFDGVADLDTSAILSFVGVGNDGLVANIQNQADAGAIDFQTTVSQRPTIVNAGSFETINSEPALSFDGNDDFLYTSLRKGATDTSVFLVCELSAVGSVDRIFDLKDNAGDSIQLCKTGGNFHMKNTDWQGGTSSTSLGTYTTGTPVVISAFFLSASNELYVNGVARTGTASSGLVGAAGTESTIGVRGDLLPVTHLTGKILFIGVSHSDLRSDRVAIEAKLNALI